jgi:hypothetical protein
MRVVAVTVVAAALFLASVWLGGPRASTAWLPAFVQLGAAIGDASAEAEASHAWVVDRVRLTFTRVLHVVRSELAGDGRARRFSAGEVEVALSPADRLAARMYGAVAVLLPARPQGDDRQLDPRSGGPDDGSRGTGGSGGGSDDVVDSEKASGRGLGGSSAGGSGGRGGTK